VIDIRHGDGMAEIDQARDAVARVRDTAGDDRGEVRKLRLDIDRDAVERHPTPHAHADRGDLVLKAHALVRPLYPDTDAILAALAAHVEGSQRPYDPFF